MTETIRLGDIAHARSGDKGNTANIGVIAYTPAGYDYLGKVLTENRMAEFLNALGPDSVQRFALPGILAYNFVVREVLDGGAGRSLRIDSQGKLLALAVLEIPLPKPANLSEMQPAGN